MLALLLALLKGSPTPFCILDEVDAALDDANVQRFVKMLQGYGEQTQFVLVTHNRATMEHADRLFGVTMDASGVSKVVTVMLPAASPNGQAASAALAEVG
jgi:chromosome segregation protein